MFMGDCAFQRRGIQRPFYFVIRLLWVMESAVVCNNSHFKMSFLHSCVTEVHCRPLLQRDLLTLLWLVGLDLPRQFLVQAAVLQCYLPAIRSNNGTALHATGLQMVWQQGIASLRSCTRACRRRTVALSVCMCRHRLQLMTWFFLQAVAVSSAM